LESTKIAIKNIEQDKELAQNRFLNPQKPHFIGLSGDSHQKYKRVDFESIPQSLNQV